MKEPPPAVPNPPRPATRLHLRVLLGPAAAVGPGKTDFLAAVDAIDRWLSPDCPPVLGVSL